VLAFAGGEEVDLPPARRERARGRPLAAHASMRSYCSSGRADGPTRVRAAGNDLVLLSHKVTFGGFCESPKDTLNNK
jgi:hypothetical protein